MALRIKVGASNASSITDTLVPSDEQHSIEIYGMKIVAFVGVLATGDVGFVAADPVETDGGTVGGSGTGVYYHAGFANAGGAMYEWRCNPAAKIKPLRGRPGATVTVQGSIPTMSGSSNERLVLEVDYDERIIREGE